MTNPAPRRLLFNYLSQTGSLCYSLCCVFNDGNHILVLLTKKSEVEVSGENRTRVFSDLMVSVEPIYHRGAYAVGVYNTADTPTMNIGSFM